MRVPMSCYSCDNNVRIHALQGTVSPNVPELLCHGSLHIALKPNSLSTLNLFWHVFSSIHVTKAYIRTKMITVVLREHAVSKVLRAKQCPWATHSGPINKLS